MYTAERGVQSRAEHAYRGLKAQLLAGDHPSGERLGEERLAGELGVSRTPVREALTRLHHDGLVERHPDGGYRPSIPDMDRIIELYEVRFALELHAVGIPGRREGALGHHDLEALKALRDQWRQVEPSDVSASDFLRLDEDFHERLASGAGNRALVAALHGVNEQIRIVRIHDYLSPGRISTTVDEHLDIVETVVSGRIEDGRRLLEDHFRHSMQIAAAGATEAVARMIGAGPN